MNSCLRTRALLAAAIGVVSFNLFLVPAARAQVPTVTAQPASGVTATNATLSGTVNPHGLATTAYFQYGLDTNYGDIGAFTDLPATNATLTMPPFVVSAITGAADSVWTQSSAPSINWTSIASSADGTHLAAAESYEYDGSIYTSTNSGATWTLSSAPYEDWVSIASSADGTRLAAAKDYNNIYYTYGAYGPGGICTSTDGGATWTPIPSPPIEAWSSVASSADGTHLAAVVNGGGIYTSTGTASGLTPGTTYHYRLVGLNDAGATFGADMTFTTAAGAPTANTLPASGVTATNATLNAAVNTGALNTAEFFEYGLDTNYGNYTDLDSLAASNTTLAVSSLAGSLSPGTTYHFQLVGFNSEGITLGGDMIFTTLPLAPVVTTLMATGVSASNATLNGTINPGNGATTAYFQFGLDTDYGDIGGFTVLPATNATLRMPGLVIGAITGAAGSQWAQSSSGFWRAIASSADGTRLAAVASYPVSGGGIYTSTNGGVTWTQSSAPNLAWASIASSADGTRLAAVVENYYDGITNYGGSIYTSTDGGLTWAQSSAPNTYWSSIASSADGTRLAAVSSWGGIYTSTDGGLTWIQSSAPSAFWSAIVSSADGTRLAAVDGNSGCIWISSDGGLAWTQSSAPPSASIASSADGTHLAAVGGGIYISTNSGLTWTQSSASGGWSAIASSADGTRLAASYTIGEGAGDTYTSTDGGLTWTNQYNPGLGLISIVSSADGTRLAAIDDLSTTGLGGDPNNIWTSTGALSGLTPGTTYHYRLVGINNGGTSLGADLTFTTAVGLPTVTTLPASGVTATNATLNATVNTGGLNTAAYFEYGLDTNYGSFTLTNRLTATNTTLAVALQAGSLLPGTTYHFQIVGFNSAGMALGRDLTFTTPPLAPVVTTLMATSVTASNATLNGTINPGGDATTAYFQYGPDTNYGGFTLTNNLVATNTTLAVASQAGSLLPGTTYHFQIVGLNSAGMALGGDLTFTTPPLAPVVTTLMATSVTASNATLNGTVNPGNGATTAYFQYGLDANYGEIGPFTDLPATNATLTMPGLVVGSITGGAGSFWNQSSAPNAGWYSIASSADGTRLAAVDGSPGYIWTSTNSGVTWTQSSAPSTNWYSIVSSADGTHLAAESYRGGIYTSTNSGVTWTQSSAPSTNWVSIASSADGTHLAATYEYRVYYDHDFGGIYTSTNGGFTWTQSSAPNTNLWNCIASSADGTRLAAGVYGGGIYISTNGGLTWAQSSAPSTGWYCIASSADGARLAAGVYGGGIYISTNGGLTWAQSSAPNAGWAAIASSADGTHLAAAGAYSGGGIFTSTNSGLTWTQFSTPSEDWTAIASSADGTRLAAGVYGGSIYTSAGTTSGLTPGTMYHYRLVGLNSAGTTLGADLTFTTAVGVPTVTTLPDSGVTATNATLNAAVNTGGLNTAAYFEYGLDTNYSSFTSTNLLMATNTTLPVSSLAASLSPGTTYHFQIVSFNSAGMALGGDLTFATPPLAPVVTTLMATSVTASNATLNGTVNPGGDATTAYFQYGLDANYGEIGPFTVLPATNATLTIPTFLVSAISGAAGSVWTQSSAPSTGWSSIASSADGTRLAAVDGSPGYIWTSTNSGVTWTQSSAPSTNWFAIASSADGTRLAAVDGSPGSVGSSPGNIWISTNGGGTWMQSSAPSTNWFSIASSADGTHLAATCYNMLYDNIIGGIYISTDGGVTWTQSSAPNLGWSSIASSADGTRLAAVSPYGIYTSINSGGTWTQCSAPNEGWQAIASSADGTRLAAVVYAGGIYTSTNGGLTWVQSSAAGEDWSSIASSADGTRLAAQLYDGGIYTSTDGGRDWTQSSAPNEGWISIASSADGMRLAAAVYGDAIYTSTGATSGLTPGTTYHYRLVGLNSAGATLGADMTFTTPVGAPTAATLPASGVTATKATLNATVNTGGLNTAEFFEYGLDTNYGNFTDLESLTASNTTLLVSSLVASLSPGTTYHFQIVGFNSAGTTFGADMTFTTAAPTANPFALSGARALAVGGKGAFQLRFTNISGLSFTVLASTNLQLPLGSWTVLGTPLETPPGQYQFTDPQATNQPQCFYRVTSP